VQKPYTAIPIEQEIDLMTVAMGACRTLLASLAGLLACVVAFRRSARLSFGFSF